MNIGATIRGYRVEKGLSQFDIEKRTGLMRCYLSRVENEHTLPSIDTLAKIAQGLDVSLADLLIGEDPDQKLIESRLTVADLHFLNEIRRYSPRLDDTGRKLLLAMVKKFAAPAVQ